MADLFRVGVTLYMVDRLTGGLALARRGLESVGMQAERAQLRIRSMEASLASSELRLGRTSNLEQRGLMAERIAMQRQRIDLAQRQAEAAERVENARRKILVGTGGVVAGGLGLVELGKAVGAAAEFQMRMEATHLAARGTREEMDQFGRVVRDTSDKTMFSISQIADMGRVAATAGIRMNGVNALMPQFASAAEILFQTKGEDPNETVKDLAMLAHQLGKYSAAGMRPVTEMAEKLALQSPEALSTFVTASGYLTPLATRGLNVPWQQVFELLATAQQITGAGKSSLSGRNLSTFMTRMLPGAGSAKQEAAIGALGLSDWYQHPDLKRLMTTLEHDHERMGSMFGAYAKLGFGEQGLRVAMLLSDPTTLMQYGRVGQYVQGAPSITDQQAQLMQTFTDQLARFSTNLSTVTVDFALGTTKEGTPGLKRLADGLKALDDVMQRHPEMTSTLFKFAAALSAVTAGAGLIALLGGLSTLLATAGIAVSAASLATGLPLIAAGIVGLAEAYEHRKGIFDAMKRVTLPPLPGSAASTAEGMGDLLKKHPGWRPPRGGIWSPPPVVTRPGGMPEWYAPGTGIKPAAYFPGGISPGGVVVNCVVNMGGMPGSATTIADALVPILTEKLLHALRAGSVGAGVHESPYFHTGSGVTGA